VCGPSYASAAGNTSGTLTVTSGGSSVSIKMIGTYTSNSFTISHDPGNHVEIIDPPVAAKGGSATSPTLGGIESKIVNVPLPQQYAAAQFALAPGCNDALPTEPSVNGSTALLTHGHG
jgi:hypothetical protein